MAKNPLDSDERDLIEAAALTRLIHANGSGLLVRALNARLHRLLLSVLGAKMGSSRIEHKVEEAMSVFTKELVLNNREGTGCPK